MMVSEIDFLVLVLPVTIWLTYVVAMQISPFHTTLGKLSLGFRVCTLRGGRPSAARIVVREVLKYPGFFFHLAAHEVQLPFVDLPHVYSLSLPS